MKINLLVVATNRYTQFLEGLLDSADQFFLKDCDVTFNVFTDKTVEVYEIIKNKPYKSQVRILMIDHKPFPYPTLHRYHFFQDNKDYLGGDHFFYVDVDALFKAPVTSEILGERVAVQHCGFVTGGDSYDRNPMSRAYVAPGEGVEYYGGGFQGASKKEFWRIVDTLTAAIDEDESRGVKAAWDDESHWNRYLIDNPPTKILSPSYHYPQNHPHIYNKWKKKGLSFKPILLLLDKNHKEVRK